MAEASLSTRELGGLRVSAAGLGCNNFGRRLDLKQTRAVVRAALDEGVSFFDTADVYGRGRSERRLGKALRGRRDEAVIATKFGMDMGGRGPDASGGRGSRRYVREAVEGSLRRLGTDRIDLYQYHQPDRVTPIAETLGALDELRREGKVREIGCSNFSARELREAGEVARAEGLAGFVSVQNEWSLLEREIEGEVLGECERWGVAVLPYFPLASGLLTGKYRRGQGGPEGSRLHGREEVADEAAFDRLEALAAFARERGIEMVDVALGWLAAQPVVASVIAGATKPEQVRSNARAVRWQPTDEDRAELDRIVPRQSVGL